MLDLYGARYDHTRWRAHVIRVDAMVRMAIPLVRRGDVVADLSCGDAAIAKRLAEALDCNLVLGDYTPGWPIEGRLEETIWQVESGSVDLWILSETIEHLQDPDWALRAIRRRASKLLLSTPIGETAEIGNPEHVWGWGVDDMEAMLQGADWVPLQHQDLIRPGGQSVYDFQLWAAG